jgi:hypothetical protein
MTTGIAVPSTRCDDGRKLRGAARERRLIEPLVTFLIPARACLPTSKRASGSLRRGGQVDKVTKMK